MFKDYGCARDSGRSSARYAALWASVAFLFSSAGYAQDYPVRPIRVVVASGAGGGTDLTARHVVKTLSDQLRYTAFVENRPGAGSTTGTDFVAKAAPDGYTLLFSSGSSIVMNGFLYKNLPYDSLRDFVPVGFAAAYPFMLITRPDLPPNTLAEFVKYARERPGKLTYASPGVGSVQHVWGTILFKSMGLDMLHVPYKAAAAAHPDVIAGRIDAMFDNLSASHKYVQAGRLKALAVSAPNRASQMPNVPTINETGVVSFDGESWMGMFAPAHTPAAIVDSLRIVLTSVNHDPDFAARIEGAGGRVLAIAAQQQQQFLRQEIERWGTLIRQYGVSAE
ncbi:MAG TPA: tripartite tricarboxylate transporter substrate binding protein [Burkholderiales bacterium]|nr:tripartite tricarboxylate transporter substrate binding protein [Burkholderiales bacterium]